MRLDRYRMLGSIGVGPDGAAYHAIDPETGAEVRLHHFVAGAASAVERADRVRARIRVLSSVEAPARARVFADGLDAPSPFVAVEWFERSLAAALAEVRADRPRCVRIGLEIADLLASAHRLGLAHGGLCPARIRLRPDGGPSIDLTGADTGDSPALGLADRLSIEPGAESAIARAAADVRSLGAILLLMLAGTDEPLPPVDAIRSSAGFSASVDQLRALVTELLSPEPDARPSAREAYERLRALAGAEATATEMDPDHRCKTAPREVTAPVAAAGETLGRYRLESVLGDGAMGRVFRARDPADGRAVAIKVLSRSWREDQAALIRFKKEARLLGEVRSPGIANLLEVNEDRGVTFMVIELVSGRSLRAVLQERGRIEEREALAIVADVARALIDVHDRGIVHRDLKPDNVLLVEAAGGPSASSVKVIDFGIARHVEETESLALTRPGAVFGTPLYMAPEQCSGTRVDARTDVYALGATLFQLVTGQAPFTADSAAAVIARHVNDRAPLASTLRPDLSEGVVRLIDAMLEKDPARRPSDARSLLAAAERLLRGEPAGFEQHPRLPACDPSRILSWDLEWDLASSPKELWPFVSNTERLNRAVGLSPVEFTTTGSASGVERTGRTRALGLSLAWREHPFEWIEGRRMGVLREYSEGPLVWFRSVVELANRPGGGTRLRHSIQVEPRGLLGRAGSAIEIGVKARRSLGEVYARIDRLLTGELPGSEEGTVDAFEPLASGLGDAAKKRLDLALDALVKSGLDRSIVAQLGSFLATAPAPEVARIRPLALARRLGVDPAKLVDACLHAAREGLLMIAWDLLCPACRGPASIQETLAAVAQHGRCEACNLGFDVDLGRSVEMIFRIHPQIRAADLGTYCIGGPVHSPHVIAQVRVAPKERFAMNLELVPGSYRITGRLIPLALDFRVHPAGAASRYDLSIGSPAPPELPRALRSGRQEIVLENPSDREVLVRLERTAERDDALTAARAATIATFRRLFPGELVAPGKLFGAARVTLLLIEPAEIDALYASREEPRVFEVLQGLYALLEERIQTEGGAIVKIAGDGVLASFFEPVAAVRAALAIQSVLPRAELGAQISGRVAIHQGSAVIVTINDRLDYFGTTPRALGPLVAVAGPGELVISDAVAEDPGVCELLAGRRLHEEVLALGRDRLAARIRLSVPVPRASARVATGVG